MVDRNLNLVQLGVGFMRLFGADLKRTGRHLATYFQLKKPLVEFNFDKILKKANSPFVLAVSYVPGKDNLKAKLQVNFFLSTFSAKVKPCLVDLVLLNVV